MGTVLLVRHGETTWNRVDRVQGWAPTSLTRRGREQARALGSFVAAEYDLDRLYSSDLERAVQTAEYVADATDLSPSLESPWRERDLGRLQGLRKGILWERYPEYIVERSKPEAAARRPDSGESVLDARDRVVEAWTRLAASLGGETAAVVTHSGPIRYVRGHVADLDIAEAVCKRKDNCGVTEIDLRGDAPTVTCANDTSFL